MIYISRMEYISEPDIYEMDIRFSLDDDLSWDDIKREIEEGLRVIKYTKINPNPSIANLSLGRIPEKKLWRVFSDITRVLKMNNINSSMEMFEVLYGIIRELEVVGHVLIYEELCEGGK